MQKILGDAKSVGSLLGQKYRIDYYQRDYKWEPKQIRGLIEDLTNRFLHDFNKEDPREKVAECGQYFLGSMIISGKGNDLFIVDGQQRITSLTLLLIYLNSLQQNREDGNRVGVDDLIYSTKFGKKSFNLNVPERNTCLQALIDGEDPDPADQPPSVQNLINRYNDITEMFPDELREDALPYFLDWLIEKVMLVEITAFSDDDAYTIFETMNDRGLSLTPTDMLKGYVLAHITDSDGRERSDDVWKQQYRAFLIVKRIRGMDTERLRDDLVKQLAPEEVGGDDYIDFHTEKAFRLHGTNGPQVHRLLARLTEFIEVKSKRVARYPEYARRSSRKGGYQIEHLWADHPENHEDEFAHPADFSAYRSRVGGLVLLPGPDNASLSDMAYSEKVKHYAKQNLLACSLHPLAYENNPGFSQFLKATSLPFRHMLGFGKADLDERQEIYTDLASLSWSPDRLK